MNDLAVFQALEPEEFHQLMEESTQKFIQKDEPIIKNY